MGCLMDGVSGRLGGVVSMEGNAGASSMVIGVLHVRRGTASEVEAMALRWSWSWKKEKIYTCCTASYAIFAIQEVRNRSDTPTVLWGCAMALYIQNEPTWA